MKKNKIKKLVQEVVEKQLAKLDFSISPEHTEVPYRPQSEKDLNVDSNGDKDHTFESKPFYDSRASA